MQKGPKTCRSFLKPQNSPYKTREFSDLEKCWTGEVKRGKSGQATIRLHNLAGEPCFAERQVWLLEIWEKYKHNYADNVIVSSSTAAP